MKHQLGLGTIIAIGLTLPAFGQEVDPLIGTWKMNLEKSMVIGARSNREKSNLELHKGCSKYYQQY